MLVKIALIIGAIGALFVMLRGAARRSMATDNKDSARHSKTNTISSTKCQVCGIYLPTGQSCDCTDRT